jgi:hypothetical protein
MEVINMSIDSSTGEPVKEPELTPNEIRKNEGLPPVKDYYKNISTKPKPDRTVSILFTVMTLITLGSIYLLATAPTGICMDSIGKALATCPSSNVSTCITSSYNQGISDTRNATLYEGYARCITETQNATLVFGYCSAQKEFVANGQYLMNDTVLVVPASIIKPICK